ncbi:hypothetical protein BKA70DRAFT_1576515, partial [Coprinopsis sp. MPI-PUGE-AT-0042]
MCYYQQGEQAVSVVEFSIICWCSIGTSIATILSCIIAPCFRTLRKSREIYWMAIFMLWLTLIVVTYGLGWKENRSRYCEILQIGRCNFVLALPKLSISMLFAILWHAYEVSMCHKSYDERPFGGDQFWRQHRPTRRVDVEVARAELQARPLSQ